jgi:hypothetical protein
MWGDAKGITVTAHSSRFLDWKIDRVGDRVEKSLQMTFRFSTKLMMTSAAILFVGLSCLQLKAQSLVDRTVATITDQSGAVELVTLSDILWQLALQPEVDFERISREELSNGLRLIIDQKLFELEAVRLPQRAVSEEDIKTEIRNLLSFFTSPAEFERKLRTVGFGSIEDREFKALVERRIKIRRYVDFRFRSFVLVTADEEDDFFNRIYAPEFKARFPGAELPSLDSKRSDIRRVLAEDKIAIEIERFLDEAKQSSEINYLVEF